MDSARAPHIDVHAGTALLGGLSPAQFMARHWQRRPLLVRAAFGADAGHGTEHGSVHGPMHGPGHWAPLDRQALFALAADEEVASRLIVRDPDATSGCWTLRHGPFPRRALPALSRPGWTLLVQGVDRRVPAARALLDCFRFVPDARLDDVMVSYASDGGGVGPHLDSYDVFLLQVQGQRRWRIAPATRAADRAVVPGLPLRILSRFVPQDDWLLAPGDMLYLPPGWAHEGTAVGGDCMTCSIGFRAPNAAVAGRETLARLLDAAADEAGAAAAPVLGSVPPMAGGPAPTRKHRPRPQPATYRDPTQPATATPAAIPPGMADFIRDAALRLVADPVALDQAIGTWLSEPHDDVWFTPAEDDDETPAPAPASTPDTRAISATASADARLAVRVDSRTRLLYDASCLYINGTVVAWPQHGAALLRRLADDRRLDAAALRACTTSARALIEQWVAAGWLHRVAAA